MRKFLISFLAALFVCTAAAAAEPNVVLEHYRAYRAALARQDLAAADKAATDALAASVARDGDGGRTGVLALNLALTRLLREDAPGALAPAQQAHGLAQAGASGIEQTYAALVLGRAEIATSGAPGADRLRQTLALGSYGGAPAEDVYLAAEALADWSLAQKDYAGAQTAFTRAAAQAAGETQDLRFRYAKARTGEGASLFFAELERSKSRPITLLRGHEAYSLLNEAVGILAPMAAAQPPGNQMTKLQSAFANGLALRTAVYVKMRSDDQLLPPEHYGIDPADDGAVEIGVPRNGAPRCNVDLISEPKPHFPKKALYQGRLAAIVLRLQIGPDGAIRQNTSWPGSATRISCARWSASSAAGPSSAGRVRRRTVGWRPWCSGRSRSSCRSARRLSA